MIGQDQSVPDRFALARYADADHSKVVVAWGRELPNGSAISLSIDDEAAAVRTTAGHCELIQSAELIWIGRAIRDSEQGSSR